MTFQVSRLELHVVGRGSWVDEVQVGVMRARPRPEREQRVYREPAAGAARGRPYPTPPPIDEMTGGELHNDAA
jgi:hypothetical protein